MSRPATREAIADLEAEMVPDRMQNGTDLGAALGEAGELLRREQSAFGPRGLLVLVTDGALPDRLDGKQLAAALGPNLEGPMVDLAVFAVRGPDDQPVDPVDRQALQTLVGDRGGVLRELRTNQIDEVVPAVLAALNQGGDVTTLRLEAGGQERPLAEHIAPGEGVEGITRLPGRASRSVGVQRIWHGARMRLALRPVTVDAAWLRPHLATDAPPRTRLLDAPGLVALVEPVVAVQPSDPQPLVHGSLDRIVVRNVLSLAYMPRARACYLNRTGATPALRDLSGRVRMAIELVRGEVVAATVQSSSLGRPEIEDCLRDGAFAVEVPRALHSDAPVTAILNLVFRPRTPEKARADDGTLSDQIDLVIEDLHRSEQGASENGRDEVRPEKAPVP
jgi:hypothetical protein